MNPRRIVPVWMAGAMALVVAGCGGSGLEDVYPVYGKVTFKDGTPLTKGMVYFQNEKYTAQGPIQDDGSYSLMSYEADDGAPPGTYKVYIAGAVEGGPDPSAEHAEHAENAPPAKPLVKQEYTDPAATPITKEVKAETNTINIEVEKAQ